MPATTSNSWGRIVAVLLKELVQLRRDRLTFAMLIGVPILQLVLFGYAINGDPRQLPTVVVASDNGPLVRSIVRAAENTGYFRGEEPGGGDPPPPRGGPRGMDCGGGVTGHE